MSLNIINLIPLVRLFAVFVKKENYSYNYKFFKYISENREGNNIT